MEKNTLFCLPYAGGSALIYKGWKEYLHSSIEVCPIEIPGRGRLFTQPLKNSIREVVDFVFELHKEQFNSGSFSFFGHSMGTILVYNLIVKIREVLGREPVHAFFSGRFPPHIYYHKILHNLPDGEFIEEIKKFGGMPDEVIENKELLQLFTPILKSDYKIIETYEHVPLESLFNFDISILNGRDDEDIKQEEIIQWENYTNRECNFYEFDGDHFFINDNKSEITEIINKTLLK